MVEQEQKSFVQAKMALGLAAPTVTIHPAFYSSQRLLSFSQRRLLQKKVLPRGKLENMETRKRAVRRRLL